MLHIQSFQDKEIRRVLSTTDVGSCDRASVPGHQVLPIRVVLLVLRVGFARNSLALACFWGGAGGTKGLHLSNLFRGLPLQGWGGQEREGGNSTCCYDCAWYIILVHVCNTACETGRFAGSLYFHQAASRGGRGSLGLVRPLVCLVLWAQCCHGCAVLHSFLLCAEFLPSCQLPPPRV